MGRRQDLESSIRESYDIIRDYEQQIRTSDRLEEKQRARAKIDVYWALIEGYLQDYIPLMKSVLPSDIAEIAAHFPKLAARITVAAETRLAPEQTPSADRSEPERQPAQREGARAEAVGDRPPVPPGSDKFKYDVFISYSRADWDWVWDTLLPRLQEAGLRVCIDEQDFEIGVSHLVNVERAVDSSRYTLIVMTPEWVNGEWNEFESLLVGSADPAGRKGKLKPCKLKPCELPKRIAMLDCADLTRPALKEMQLERLIGSLKRGAPVSEPAAVRPQPATPNPELPTPNPFGVVGRITDPARFFGHEDLLRQIFEELSKGVNVSLVGESQMGKSSILSMVCVWGPQRLNLPPERFAYLSLAVVDNEDEFYEALCDLLHIEPCRGFKLTRALQGRRYILCLDEIEKMTWDGFTVRVRNQLRGLADGADAPLKLVIASRQPLAHLFPDSPELGSPLAGICRALDVRPFSPSAARAFLLNHLQGASVTFSESEIAALIAQTGGYPARLQQAAADLFHQKARNQVFS